MSPFVSSVRKRASSGRSPYQRLGDAELVRAVVAGDTEAAGAVWERYATVVRSVIRGNLSSDAIADDLVQEVFLAFLRCAPRMRAADSLRSFLVGISLRVSWLEIRRRKIRRWVTLSPTGAVPEGAEAPNELSATEVLWALRRVLERMPARRREAFMLRQAHGFEIPEIAKALEVSESTVKREVVRARESIFVRGRREPALAQYLEGYRMTDRP